MSSTVGSQRVRTRRLSLRRPAFTLVFSALLMPLGGATASGQVIVEVQEDWELVVAEPDANSSGPQVTCVISPDGNLNGLHAALELNQQTYPHYTPGGVQLHAWGGEYVLESKSFPSDAVLNATGETIRWTHRMAIVNSQLVFDIDDGESTAWGNFGANGYLWIDRNTSLSNLNGYSPQVSVANSGVGYAANRVERLVLKEVRYYTALGLHARDTTQRVVHELAP